MDDDFGYDEDDIESDLSDDDWGYLETIDLIDWNYDRLVGTEFEHAIEWEPVNNTRGICPSRAVLIIEGPASDGYTRRVVVPSLGMNATEFASLVKHAASMAAMAAEAHTVVSEQPDGD